MQEKVVKFQFLGFAGGRMISAPTMLNAPPAVNAGVVYDRIVRAHTVRPYKFYRDISCPLVEADDIDRTACNPPALTAPQFLIPNS